MTIVKEHVRISCQICSLQLPRHVAVDILAGFLTCTQSAGVGCLQLPRVLASQAALSAPGGAARQQGLSSARSLCKEGSYGLFPGCSSFLGKLRHWLFPPYLCVPISLWFLTFKLRMKRRVSCKAWIQSVSKLSRLSDTDTEGSVGSGA